MLVKCGLLKLLGNIVLPHPYYPVGRIILTMSVDDNPNTIYKGQSWSLIAKGKTLVGVDEDDNDFNEVNKIGGEKTHKLTIDEMPAHNHELYYPVVGGVSNVNGYQWGQNMSNWGGGPTKQTGGSQAHNNMPPYITCYIWQRTA